MIFPCTKCGACCRIAYMIPDFPEPITKTGACHHLTSNNQCGIYDNRPEICNLRAMQVLSKMPEQEFYQKQADFCNTLMDIEGLGEDKRVKL